MVDATYQTKVYEKQGGTELVVASGGKITVESGGTLDVKSGATFTIGDGTTAPADVALAQGSIIVGDANGFGSALDVKTSGRIIVGNGTTGVSVAVSGDAMLAANGALTIGNGAVTNAKLASGAAVGALITAGLGASASYLKTQNTAATLLASVVGARSVIIVVVVDETFADVGGTQPTFTIGQTGTANKFADTAAFANKTAGTVLTFAGILTGSDNLIVTGSAATVTGTGGITVTVLALPT